MGIQTEILNRMQNGSKLIDVICELVEGSDEIDYHDVAEVIKDNPTMMAIVEKEFQKRNLLPKEKDEINLTDIFKEL